MKIPAIAFKYGINIWPPYWGTGIHVDEIAKDYKIDILINNAGIAHVGNVENTQEEDLDRVYNVNVKGVYNCIHATIPKMKANNGGVIVNITSIASSVGISDRFAYSMSKGAALTMTYSVAKDYLDNNIRCNCISPARVHTPFVDGFIKKNYPGNKSKLLFTDTDSLTYLIETENIYQDMYKNRELFKIYNLHS